MAPYWRKVAVAILPGFIAAGLVIVATIPTASPAAAASIPGRMCSGIPVTGSFSTPSDSASYKLAVPNGATVQVTGNVDILGKDTSGGWQTIFKIQYLNDPGWYLGSYYGGPYQNVPLTPKSWMNGGPSGDVTFNVSQQAGTRINWRFTVVVNGVAATGACTPFASLETSGPNCAVPNAASVQGTAADPVNTATGNFHEPFNDLVIPGRGPGLARSHAYNSLAAAYDGPLGFGWSHSYGMTLVVAPVSGIVTVRQEGGAEIHFYPDGAGGYEAPPRVVASLVYNAGPGTWTLKRCEQVTMTFSSNGQLQSATDLNGYSTTLQYVGATLSTVTDSAGRKLHFSWTGSHISSVTDDSVPARSVSFVYDAGGNLIDYTDVASGTWHFTYDGSHRLLTMRRPRQAALIGAPVTTNTYDASGRVSAQSDELGRITSFDYTTIPGSTKVTDPKGNVTVEAYQNLVRTSLTRGYGSASAATWNFETDGYTLGITKVTDPNGRVTTATYDRRGNMLSRTDALGHTATATYNEFDQPLTLTDKKGVTTTFVYDLNGNPVSQSTPLVGSGTARTTTFGYDPARPGDLVSITDPTNQVWQRSYDAFGYVTSTTDPLGNTRRFAYDTSKGWPTKEVTPVERHVT